MKSLYSDNAIRSLPKEMIRREDYFYLGYVDGYDTYLVVEEWEFRIYNFEWWSYESIVDWEHEEEDWRCDIGAYFQGREEEMDKDSCEYCVAKFDSNNPLEMALELANVCSEELEDNTYTRADDGLVKAELVDFLKRWMVKVKKYQNSFAYHYYK